jgi:aquaporin Z
VVAQVIGAVAAVAAVFVTVPDKLASAVVSASATSSDLMARAANGWGTASPLYTASQGQVEFGLVAALVVETLGAAVLVGVVLANRPTARAALAVGATYGAVLLLASPITGGGFNPARSTGAALFTLGSTTSPVMGQLWLFWVAPLLGGAIAGLVKLAFGVRETSFVPAEV